MKLFANDAKKQMVNYVIKYLCIKYNYNHKVAKDMVLDSVFIEMLNKDPEITMHYSVEYWAKDIINENKMVFA